MDFWVDEQGQEFGMWAPAAPEGRKGWKRGSGCHWGSSRPSWRDLGLEKVFGIPHPSPLHDLGKEDDPRGDPEGGERRLLAPSCFSHYP